MFIAEDVHEAPKEPELTRATADEKNARHEARGADAIQSLQVVGRDGGHVVEELLRTVRSCSLGQISNALYEVGGQYRRSM